MHVYTQTDQANVGDDDDLLSVPASSDPNVSACTENEIDYMGLSKIWRNLRILKFWRKIYVAYDQMIPDPELNSQVNIVGCWWFVDKTHELACYYIQLKSPIFPAQVEGDGNCLTRAASVCCYGYEQGHIEMRAGITNEIAAHSELYIDNVYRRLGTN